MPRFVLLCPQIRPALKILRPRATYVVGRDPLADVRLPSDSVSRRHAELEWTMTNGFILRDRRSTNGTRVNGVPVLQPRLLRDGDQIQIGNFRLAFREYHGDLASIGDDESAEGTITDDDLAALRDGPAAAEAFGGNFTSHELLEVCRLIALNEKDGVLTVWGEKLNGQLVFVKGEIVRARTGEAKGAGAEAAHTILAVQRGRFEFAAGACGLERNCRLKAEPLIMEVARRLDQEAAPPEPPQSDPANQTKRIVPRFSPLSDVNPIADRDRDEP